jgi:hypothetical protein
VVFDVTQDWTGAMILCEVCLAHPLRKFFGYVKVVEVLGLGVSIASETDFVYEDYKARVQHVTDDYLGKLDHLRASARANGISSVDRGKAEQVTGESSGVEGRVDVSSDQLALDLTDFREILRSE